MSKPLQQVDSWFWKRVYIGVTGAFAMVVIAYIIFTGMDTETSRTCLTWAWTYLLGSTIGYAGVATWETNKTRAILGKEGTAASLSVPLKESEKVYVKDRRGSPPVEEGG